MSNDEGNLYIYKTAMQSSTDTDLRMILYPDPDVQIYPETFPILQK